MPDSCCLKPTKGCGKDLFNKHSLKKMAEYVKKIHVHGCLHAMDKVLKVHTQFKLPNNQFLYVNQIFNDMSGNALARM